MTPQDYLDKYGDLAKWLIHKRYHDADDRLDAFQEVAMIICERIDQLNNMPADRAKRYILHSTKYCWLKWYKHTKRNILQHRTLGQDDEKATLDWLFESNKYRPDRFYDSELKWRAHREDLQDQMDEWNSVKNVIAGIQRTARNFGKRNKSNGGNLFYTAFNTAIKGLNNGKKHKR